MHRLEYLNRAIEWNNSGVANLQNGAIGAAMQIFRDVLRSSQSEEGRSQRVSQPGGPRNTSHAKNGAVIRPSSSVEEQQAQDNCNDQAHVRPTAASSAGKNDSAGAERTSFNIPLKTVRVNSKNIPWSVHADDEVSVAIFPDAFLLAGITEDMFPHDRGISDPQKWLATCEIQIISVTTYNVALACHIYGIRNGLSCYLMTAMTLYEQAHETSQAISSLCGAVFLPLLAIVNNMGHIQMSLACFDEAQRLFFRLQFLLQNADSSTCKLIGEFELALLTVNFIQGTQFLNISPAA